MKKRKFLLIPLLLGLLLTGCFGGDGPEAVSYTHLIHYTLEHQSQR